MNEVKVTPVIVPQIAKTTSSEESKTDNATTPADVGGKELPLEHVSGSENLVAMDKPQARTEAVVEEVNQFVQSVQRDLHFSVDEDSGMTVIRVRDKESGELIRQIPEDIFLNMAQNLKDSKSIQLLDTHS